MCPTCALYTLLCVIMWDGMYVIWAPFEYMMFLTVLSSLRTLTEWDWCLVPLSLRTRAQHFSYFATSDCSSGRLITPSVTVFLHCTLLVKMMSGDSVQSVDVHTVATRWSKDRYKSSQRCNAIWCCLTLRFNSLTSPTIKSEHLVWVICILLYVQLWNSAVLQVSRLLLSVESFSPPSHLRSYTCTKMYDVIVYKRHVITSPRSNKKY